MSHHFAITKLLQVIIAYFFQEWSKIIKSEVNIEENMTHVPQPSVTCDCKPQKPNTHEDL